MNPLDIIIHKTYTDMRQAREQLAGRERTQARKNNSKVSTKTRCCNRCKKSFPKGDIQVPDWYTGKGNHYVCYSCIDILEESKGSKSKRIK